MSLHCDECEQAIDDRAPVICTKCLDANEARLAEAQASVRLLEERNAELQTQLFLSNQELAEWKAKCFEGFPK